MFQRHFFGTGYRSYGIVFAVEHFKGFFTFAGKAYEQEYRFHWLFSKGGMLSVTVCFSLSYLARFASGL